MEGKKKKKCCRTKQNGKRVAPPQVQCTHGTPFNKNQRYTCTLCVEWKWQLCKFINMQSSAIRIIYIYSNFIIIILFFHVICVGVNTPFCSPIKSKQKHDKLMVVHLITCFFLLVSPPHALSNISCTLLTCPFIIIFSCEKDRTERRKKNLLAQLITYFMFSVHCSFHCSQCSSCCVVFFLPLFIPLLL